MCSVYWMNMKRPTVRIGPIPEDDDKRNPNYRMMDRVLKKSKMKLPMPMRLFVAETMGTFILMMFGIGSVAHFVIGKGNLGSYLSVNFGWGLGVTFGVYWSAGISGGHINPAVTLAMVVAGRLEACKLPLYWAGQTLGAFLASALCFGVYNDLITDFENGGNKTLATAGIFAPYANANISHGTIFGDQVVGTMLLVGTIFALVDKRNNSPNKELLPVAIGFLVLVIGDAFGLNVGYGINPARDLIPRIFTSIAGWKTEPFKTNGYFFWIPIIGQLIGGILGAVLYLVTIEMHHTDEDHLPMVTDNEADDNEKL